jgi:hypothetical protein
MKIEDIREDLEKSKKYEEDLDRITVRLKEISKQKSGRISAEEAWELVTHIKRLRLLEGYHQIESFILEEARKEYDREGVAQVPRLRATARALGFEDGKRGRKPEKDARWILSMFNRLRKSGISYVDALSSVAKKFEVEEIYGGLKTVEKIIERAKKKNPDMT